MEKIFHPAVRMENGLKPFFFSPLLALDDKFAAYLACLVETALLSEQINHATFEPHFVRSQSTFLLVFTAANAANLRIDLTR